MTITALELLRRKSRLALDREGRWSFDGRPVEHPRVARLFHQGVRAVDGGFTLHVGEQWAYIEHVEDTAWFVEAVHLDGDQLLLTLAGGDVEPLDPTKLTARGGRDVYCLLSGGRRARFLRQAVAMLLPFLDEQDGVFSLVLGDDRFPIGPE